jgi:hypothetical protein
VPACCLCAAYQGNCCLDMNTRRGQQQQQRLVGPYRRESSIEVMWPACMLLGPTPNQCMP